MENAILNVNGNKRLIIYFDKLDRNSFKPFVIKWEGFNINSTRNPIADDQKLIKDANDLDPVDALVNIPRVTIKFNNKDLLYTVIFNATDAEERKSA